ncbi:MAG: hypothetical protein WA002_04920, partial [Candidatus Acidiferrales bacterium]
PTPLLAGRAGESNPHPRRRSPGSGYRNLFSKHRYPSSGERNPPFPRPTRRIADSNPAQF